MFNYFEQQDKMCPADRPHPSRITHATTGARWLCRLAAVGLLLTVTSGCATMFNGGATFRLERREPIIAVMENGIVVAGAVRDFDERVPTMAQAQALIASAPRVLELQPRRCHTTVYEVRTASGAERVTVRSPVGAGWIVLDYLLTGIFGMLVDIGTGAWCGYEESRQ